LTGPRRVAASHDGGGRCRLCSDGSIASLRDFVEDYSESDLELLAFDPTRLEPALRLMTVNNAADVLQQRDDLLAGVVLTDDLVDN